MAQDPVVLAHFGEVLADLDTFEMLELKTLGTLQPGQNPGPVSSVLKLRASRMKQAIAELGVEILGPESLRSAAMSHAAPFVRHDGGDAAFTAEDAIPTLLPDFLNSRAFTIFGGAAEVQLGIIAKALVGV